MHRLQTHFKALATSCIFLAAPTLAQERMAEYLPLEHAQAKVVTKLTGMVKSTRQVSLKAEVEGVISYVLEEGRAVPANQVVATVEVKNINNNLATAKKQLAILDQMVSLNLEHFLRVESLQQSGKASKKTLDESRLKLHEARYALEQAQASVQRMSLLVQKSQMTVDFDAIITRVERFENDYVQPGDVVAKLIDRNNLYIELGLSEDIAAMIDDNTEVLINTGNAQYNGSINNVYQFVDPLTQRKLVRLTANKTGVLAMGQIVDVQLSFNYADTHCFSVPRSLVQLEKNQRWIWVADPDNKSQKRYISNKVGSNMADKSLVCEGVQTGDKLLTNQFIQYKEGETLKLSMKEGALLK
jgi:membrane fusion protein (multidrug efflux system)